MIYLRSPQRRIAVSTEYEKKIDHDTCGKWVLKGKRVYMGRLFKRVRALVFRDELYEVKFMRVKRGVYALLVYADEDTKQEALEKLSSLGVPPGKWKDNSVRKKHGGLARAVLYFN